MAPMEPRQQFAQNLRHLREQAGLSQEALGYKCALHRTEISLLERAGRDPRLSTLVRLARALDVSLGALLHGIT
jgi:transcriptional regulator with XRE-family HTH domain